MSQRWMLNEIARIDDVAICEPCAEEARGQEIDAYLIAEFLHARQRLVLASIALREAYDLGLRQRVPRMGQATHPDHKGTTVGTHPEAGEVLA